nr:hypothetical protein [Tanacetum cinerariifolium]
MGVIWFFCEKYLDASIDGVDKPILTSDSPIVQTVFIKSKPGSYAGAADASSSVNFKGKANFFQLEYKNVCDCVELSIPFKVFEMVKPDDVLKKSITMGILLFDGSRFSKKMVRVEYEWKPPRCEQCKIFGHVHDQCPKNIMITLIVEKSKDGFEMVVNSKKNVSVPKKGTANVLGSSNQNNKPPKVCIVNASSIGRLNDKNGGNTPNILVSNPYDALDDKSEEEVEIFFDEYFNLLRSAKIGASASTYSVLDG